MVSAWPCLANTPLASVREAVLTSAATVPRYTSWVTADGPAVQLRTASAARPTAVGRRAGTAGQFDLRPDALHDVRDLLQAQGPVIDADVVELAGQLLGKPAVGAQSEHGVIADEVSGFTALVAARTPSKYSFNWAPSSTPGDVCHLPGLGTCRWRSAWIGGAAGRRSRRPAGHWGRACAGRTRIRAGICGRIVEDLGNDDLWTGGDTC